MTLTLDEDDILSERSPEFRGSLSSSRLFLQRTTRALEAAEKSYLETATLRVPQTLTRNSGPRQ